MAKRWSGIFPVWPGSQPGTGKEIRTVVGWGELDYAHDRDTTFIAGYGFDNPMNSDLVGTAAEPTPNICSITVAI